MTYTCGDGLQRRNPYSTRPPLEDPRLERVHAKVEAGERLSYEDGLALYRSPDLLGVGWMANRVRERLNGNKTHFHVNRHINPTDVCVASCKLCAFGKKARDPKAYTMSLEQVWENAWQIGWTEAINGVSHRRRVASGTHARLVLPDAARPQGTLPHGTLESLHDGGDRLLCAAD